MTPAPLRFASPVQRTGAAFFLTFLVGGVMGPFISPMLAALGYTHAQAGLVMATASFCGMVAPVLMGRLSDAFQGAAYTLRFCSAVAVTLAAALWWQASRQSGPNIGFVILLLMLAAVRAPTGSLLDTLGMQAAKQQAATYGRLRLIGSMGFMAAAGSAGVLLGEGHLMRFFPSIVTLTAIGAAATWLVPSSPPTPILGAAAPSFWRSLDRPFCLWMAAMMLHWFAFAPYNYGFTLYMQEHHVPERLLGVFWSLGVLAEVVAFATCGWFFQRLSAYRVLMLALSASLLRWALLGFFPTWPVIAAAQLLHGPGFALYYAAAMQILGARRHSHGSYQGLFSTCVAFAACCGTAVAGALHQSMPYHNVLLCMMPVQAAALLLLVSNPGAAAEPNGVRAPVRKQGHRNMR